MSIYRAQLRNTSNVLSPRVSSEQIRLQVPPKRLESTAGSLRQSSSEFQPVGLATEKARVPNSNQFFLPYFNYAYLNYSSAVYADEHSKRHKRNMILKALSASPPDVATLRQLSISRGGLLDDSLRKRAWPCLLDIDIQSIPPKPGEVILHLLFFLFTFNCQCSNKRDYTWLISELIIEALLIPVYY